MYALYDVLVPNVNILNKVSKFFMLALLNWATASLMWKIQFSYKKKLLKKDREKDLVDKQSQSCEIVWDFCINWK